MAHEIHKYKRVDIGRDKDNPYYVYRCLLPNCNHYIPEKLILGRTSICWSCLNEFVITVPKKLKPICVSCKNKKFGKDGETERILRSIGIIK